jgi:lipopolysaccharide export LptBFGC system permease protein LptF
MKNEKPKLERYQKILLGFSFVFLAVALVCLILDIMRFCEGGLRLMWIPLSISNILQYCARWKQNPKTNTIFIVLWSVIFCGYSIVYFISVFK